MGNNFNDKKSESFFLWIRELFGKDKPIITMVHLGPLPDDPFYSRENGMKGLIEGVRQDLYYLQDAGVDAVMFSNENSRPYLTKYGPAAIAAMTRIVTAVLPEVKVPYGVNVLWDPISTIAIAKAVDAKFVREVFTGVYDSDMGLWNTNCGEALRYRHQIDGDNVKLFYNIHPEFGKALSDRPISEIARTNYISSLPDVICVSGAAAGMETSTALLKEVKEAVPEVPVFVNTGVNINNVEEQLSIADGAVVASSLKIEGDTWKSVDPNRAKEFMSVVRKFRDKLAKKAM